MLLTDIQMPETDGFAVLELLRSSNIPQAGSIPVIALTARMDDDKEYLPRGFARCIRKPFTMENLTEGVAEVVGKVKAENRRPDFSLILAGEDNKRKCWRCSSPRAGKTSSGYTRHWKRRPGNRPRHPPQEPAALGHPPAGLSDRGTEKDHHHASRCMDNGRPSRNT